jgi:uncharacterized membrane-anchored protein
MIRVIIYLLIVGLFAFGAAWLADRPGEVMITWQKLRIETSLMVLMVAVATIAVLAVLLWTIVRAVLRAPDVLWLYLRTRRGVRGYLAVSQGLIAIGSGDARAARRFADEAARIAPGEPLTLLLGAQASQLSGDREAAERTFHVMAAREDTRLLGLHGLFIEAQRRNDVAAATLYAEQAAESARAELGGAGRVRCAVRRRRLDRALERRTQHEAVWSIATLSTVARGAGCARARGRMQPTITTMPRRWRSRRSSLRLRWCWRWRSPAVLGEARGPAPCGAHR